MDWSGKTGGDAAKPCSGGDGESGGSTYYDYEEYYAVRSYPDGRMGTVSEYYDHDVYVLWAARTLDDGVRGATG